MVTFFLPKDTGKVTDNKILKRNFARLRPYVWRIIFDRLRSKSTKGRSQVAERRSEKRLKFVMNTMPDAFLCSLKKSVNYDCILMSELHLGPCQSFMAKLSTKNISRPNISQNRSSIQLCM